MACELETGQGRLTTHEADHGALHARPQPESLDELQVEARRVEAGAGGDDQMGDRLAPRRGAESQDRRFRQAEGMPGEEAHARRRVGERPAREQADAVQFAWRGVRLDERVAMLDLGPVGHAPEQPPRALVGQELRRKGHELGVDVELRHGRGDMVEMGHGHVGIPSGWTSEVIEFPGQLGRRRALVGVRSPVARLRRRGGAGPAAVHVASRNDVLCHGCRTLGLGDTFERRGMTQMRLSRTRALR